MFHCMYFYLLSKYCKLMVRSLDIMIKNLEISTELCVAFFNFPAFSLISYVSNNLTAKYYYELRNPYMTLSSYIVCKTNSTQMTIIIKLTKYV